MSQLLTGRCRHAPDMVAVKSWLADGLRYPEDQNAEQIRVSNALTARGWTHLSNRVTSLILATFTVALRATAFTYPAPQEQR